MSVSAITGQAPALQQQLTRVRALAEPAHGAVPEAVAIELVPAWSPFAACERAGAGAGKALAVAAGKTGALLACARQLRVLAGGAGKQQARPSRLPTVLTVALRKPLFPHGLTHALLPDP